MSEKLEQGDTCTLNSIDIGYRVEFTRYIRGGVFRMAPAAWGLYDCKIDGKTVKFAQIGQEVTMQTGIYLVYARMKRDGIEGLVFKHAPDDNEESKGYYFVPVNRHGSFRSIVLIKKKICD